MYPFSTTSSDSGSDGAVDAGADDGLVALPDEPTSAAGRRRAVAVGALAIALLLGTALVDTLWPYDQPPLLGVERHRRATLRARARLADGSLARFVENELRIRSRVRRWLLPPYAMALYRGLGETRKELLVGRDGWLFLRLVTIPRRARDAELIDHAVDLMAAVEARLARRSSRVVWVPLPRKAGLCRAFLPPGVEPRAALDRRLAEALRERGVGFVDLLPAWEARAAAGALPYSRTDSHWTPATAAASAEEIARQIGRLAPPEQRRSQLDWSQETLPGFDLLRYVGVPTSHASRWLRPAPLPAPRVLREDGQVAERLRSLEADAAIALVGTSFSDLSGLASFVEHFTQTRVLDASRAANNPLQLLRELIARRDERGLPLPGIILIEVPIHMLFVNAPLDRLTAAEVVPDPP